MKKKDDYKKLCFYRMVRIVVYMKTQLRRRGGSYQARTLHYLKNSFTFQHHILTPASHTNSNNLLLKFLQDTQKLHQTKNVFKLCYDRCIRIQDRFRIQIKLNREREDNLLKFWNEQCTRIVQENIKKAKRNLKVK